MLGLLFAGLLISEQGGKACRIKDARHFARGNVCSQDQSRLYKGRMQAPNISCSALQGKVARG